MPLRRNVRPLLVPAGQQHLGVRAAAERQTLIDEPAAEPAVAADLPAASRTSAFLKFSKKKAFRFASSPALVLAP